MYDESGHTNFLFLCPEQVMLLPLAHARLSPCPGFIWAGSPLLTLIIIFGRLRRSLRNLIEDTNHAFCEVDDSYND